MRISLPQLTGIGRFLLQMSSPFEEISSEKEERARAQGPWAGAHRWGVGGGVGIEEGRVGNRFNSEKNGKKCQLMTHMSSSRTL